MQHDTPGVDDMDDPGHHSGGRRSEDRTASVKFAISIVGAVIAIATLVWGAARIASSVDNMNLAVTDLRSTTNALKETITGILVQQARNDAEIQALKIRMDSRR